VKSINACKDCHSYTMNVKCSCGGEAVKAGPPKYSPHDNYASYRREAKKGSLKEAGLI
jgi:rRNA maturation protein Nop10